MATARKDNDAVRISRDICREYLHDNCPEMDEIFPRIWEMSRSSRIFEAGKKGPGAKNEIKGLKFVGNGFVEQMLQVVIPFVTGVVSIIVADKIIQKLDTDREELIRITRKKGKEARMTMNINKSAADEILKYILSGILKENPSMNMNKVDNL